MRKQLPGVVILALSVTAPTILAKQYRAERFDVSIDISSSGAIEVLETTVFTFSGGPFTYVFREVSADRTDGLQFIEATLDGQPAPVSVSNGPSLRVQWNFAPTSDGVRSTTLRYRVAGAIRQTAYGDALAWRLFPPKAKYRIDASRVELIPPAGVQISGVTLSGADSEIQRSAGAAIVSMANVRAPRKVVLQARFPAGSLIQSPPRWEQVRSERRRQIMSGVLYGGICGAVLIVLGLIWMPRPPKRYGSVAWAATEFPNAPPAIFATLAGQPNAPQAMLLDLARRGAVRVEEQRSWWGSRFRITRGSTAVMLTEHERVFLQTGFRPGETELPLSDFAGRVQSGGRAINDAIYAEMRAQGLIDPDRENVKRSLRSTGFMSLLAAIALGAGAAILQRTPEVMGFLLMLAIACTVLAVLAAVMAVSADVWTFAGAERAAQAKSFVHRMRDITRGRASYDQNVFESWLPYAAAVGLGTAFAKRYHRETSAPLPGWFASMQGSDGSDAAFIAFMASSDSGASGGGGGASGGGDGGAG